MITGLTYQELSTVYINSADWFVIRRISKKKKKTHNKRKRKKRRKEKMQYLFIYLITINHPIWKVEGVIPFSLPV